MMAFLLLGLWVTPHMTFGHLLLSVGMTVYIMVGVHFEERALAEELGLAYVQYQTRTPKFLPVQMPTDSVPESSSGTPSSRGAV